MVGRQKGDAAKLDGRTTGLLELDTTVEDPAERRRPESDYDLRAHRLDLREKVAPTRRNLVGLGRSIGRWPALYDVRDVGFPSRKAGGLQDLVEDLARGSSEGASRGVFVPARCLADHEHGGVDGSLSWDRVDASRMEATPRASPHSRGGFTENLHALLRPDPGAGRRRHLNRSRLHALRSETRFVRVRIFG